MDSIHQEFALLLMVRILEHEQAMDADLIVMGKHGQPVMEELLLGSVTKHVLSHSSSDVFIAGLGRG